jgi:hypothetical protein
LEKRQATLQLWICADETFQYVKPTIIFSGSRGPKSKLPWPDEAVWYEQFTNIRVAFQSSAWADEVFCEGDILNVAEDMRQANIQGEVAIGMDNHSAQRTPKMRRLYTDLGMLEIFTSANCTDCISPVDHHVGNFIQNHMKASYNKEVEENRDIWIAGCGGEEEEIEGANGTGAKILTEDADGEVALGSMD